MKIGIIGGGSLGLMWAARLSLAEAGPHLLVRTASQRDRIREEGLIYLERGKRFRLHPHVALLEEGIPSCDLLVLAVKQTHIDPILPWLEKLGPDYPFLLTLQNGMGHLEKLGRVFPAERLLTGVTTEGAMRLELNGVERTGFGETWIGREGTKAVPEEIAGILRDLNRLGFRVQWDEHITQRMWIKLLINSVINPLTALLEIRNGELMRLESLYPLMRRLLEEGMAVAEAEGVQISLDMWEEIGKVCRNTSTNRSSMAQDLLSGRATEIGAINGYIVEKALLYRIDAPAQRSMVDLIRAREELCRERGR